MDHCKCAEIHKLDREREDVWRNKHMLLEDRIKLCLVLYEKAMRKEAEIFEQ